MAKTVIMGAGPAGLAAGYRLTKNGGEVALLEAESMVGGISKTIQYKDNYFDLGGHRFFTKFNEVNEFWNEVLGDQFVRTPRLSRIYTMNKFFNYPLTPMNAFFGVGVFNFFVIVGSYIKIKISPYPEEKTFEQWVSNRFGKKLYSMFFKTYSEKLWGIPCSQLGAEFSAQRIKGLSLTSAIKNALFKPRNNKIKTLINEFHYPVHGPGMMYTEAQNKIEKAGGKVFLNSRVVRVKHQNFKVQSVEYVDEKGASQQALGDYFISSIPLSELVLSLDPLPDQSIVAAAQALRYRSFITIDVIINKEKLFPDNWIYIHSPEVKLGRIQNFKNWSIKMVADPNKTSLGLEYFCNENDEFWNMPDEELFKQAATELERIKICKSADIEDYKVVRVPKAYPVYLAGYQENVDKIKDYLKKITNLQCVGRYGLFKYNNMDHSILTGFYAAQNILAGKVVGDTWEVNTEEEYHEEKKAD